MKTRMIIRGLMSVGALGVLAFLAYQDYKPSGTLRISANFSRPTPYLFNFGPREFLGAQEVVSGAPARRITGDVVSFDMRLPRWFRTATVRVTWTQEGGPWQARTETFGLRALPHSRNTYHVTVAFPGASAERPIHISLVEVTAHR